MRAFTYSIHAVDSCLRISVNINAAHKIVLTRKYRHSVFSKVKSLTEKILVYHRESVLKEFRILVSDIKIKFC